MTKKNLIKRVGICLLVCSSWLWSAILFWSIQDWPGATWLTGLKSAWQSVCFSHTSPDPISAGFALLHPSFPSLRWWAPEAHDHKWGASPFSLESSFPILMLLYWKHFQAPSILIPKTKSSCFAKLSRWALQFDLLKALDTYTPTNQGLAVQLLREENKTSNSQQQEWQQLLAQLHGFLHFKSCWKAQLKKQRSGIQLLQCQCWQPQQCCRVRRSAASLLPPTPPPAVSQ